MFTENGTEQTKNCIKAVQPRHLFTTVAMSTYTLNGPSVRFHFLSPHFWPIHGFYTNLLLYKEPFQTDKQSE